jgi:hypothetical protein
VSDTGLDAAKELSEKNPSMFGIVLSVIGLLLDAGALLKALKAMQSVAKSAQGLSDLAGTGYTLKEIKKIKSAFDDFLTAKNPLKQIDEHAKKLYEALGKNRLGGKSLAEFTED